MTLKLYGKGGRASKILIAAKYSGITIEIADFTMGVDNKSAEFLKKNPTGKVPVLETEEGSIFESNAILRYIARKDGKLYGKNDFEAGLIDQWMDFSVNEIELPAAAWVYPIFGYATNNPLATKRAQEDIKRVFEILDSHLISRTYFVGNTVSIADLVVFTGLKMLYENVLDAAFRKDFVNVNRWFATIANQPNVKAIVGEVKLAEKVAVAAAPAKKEKAPKEEKPKPVKEEKPKPAPKQSNDEEEEDEPQEEKKKPNPLDALPKSTFVLDEWKRQYSNNDTRAVALPWFFENIDLTGYSLWWSEYKYNNELTKVFMTSNLIGGNFQRLDAARKYIFGNVHIFGEEPDKLEVKGAWLFRGTEVPQIVNDCDDTEHYVWTRIDLNNPEQKKALEDFWAWDGELEGKKLQASKTFK